MTALRPGWPERGGGRRWSTARAHSGGRAVASFSPVFVVTWSPCRWKSSSPAGWRCGTRRSPCRLLLAVSLLLALSVCVCPSASLCVCLTGPSGAIPRVKCVLVVSSSSAAAAAAFLSYYSDCRIPGRGVWFVWMGLPFSRCRGAGLAGGTLWGRRSRFGLFLFLKK